MSFLNKLLQDAMKEGASDIHLKHGIVPMIRAKGNLKPLDASSDVLTGQEIEQMALQIMNARQKVDFERNWETDIAYGVPGLGRFRINIFKQRGSISMVIRSIPMRVPDFQELALPPVIQEIANNERGLILVTGVTGSGKSTTIASMISYINQNKNKHIITIEDPIEFLIRDEHSIISQRELGNDTQSFAKALRAAMRQDPDVILIGEMRDKETVETALVAAETGHLVFSTLHTSDSAETLNRILSLFEPHMHQQIRIQLASSLKSVISQRLATSKDGSRFYPAMEILINNKRIAEMILDPNKSKQIIKAIEESHETFGMQSFDQSLMQLVSQQKIDYQEALALSTNPSDFALRYKGVVSLTEKQWNNFDANEEGQVRDEDFGNTLNIEEIEKTDPKVDQDAKDIRINAWLKKGK